VLVDSMIEHNGVELLVHRLISLTEAASDDEGKAVFNTLSIFENMVEVKPEVRPSIILISSIALERCDINCRHHLKSILGSVDEFMSPGLLLIINSCVVLICTILQVQNACQIFEALCAVWNTCLIFQ